MHNFLFELTILTAASVIFVPIFKWLKMGPILAYLFAGVLIGPYLFSFISNPESILSFSELGVIFLLFILGLELAPKTLWKLRGHIFGLGFLQVLVTGALLTLLGYRLGLSLPAAYITGFGLAMSGTALAIQILEDNRQLKTTHGQGSFAILMFQDLAIVPLMLSLSLFNEDISRSALSWFPFIKGVLVIVFLVLIGPRVVRWGLCFIADTRLQEVFIATSLLIVIGTGLLFESIGLSMGMGAFVAGILLAESEYKHELETSLKPFKSLLIGLFFIAVGMSLNLDIVMSKPHIVLMLTFTLISIKALVVYVLARLFKFPNESARNMGATLLQGGGFGFVLFNLALSQNLMDVNTVSILNATIILSMVLTPFLFNINQKLLKTYSELSEKPFDNIESDGAEVIIAGWGRFGQVVCRFLNSQDVKFTILEHSASQVEVARKFKRKVYYGDASRLDILEAAGTKDAKYFVIAIDDVEKSIETASAVKKNFPNIKIIARARDRQHVIELKNLGITDIYRETLLTSLEVAKDIMLDRGANKDNIAIKLAQFIKKDSEILDKQFELQKNEVEYLNFTNEANKELETILRLDQNEDINKG